VTDILGMRDIEVLTAAGGKEGLAVYKVYQSKIALVLLDLSMPGWSGEETMREIRKVNPETRIILSSGYNEVEATRRFAGKGLTGFLQKPYSADKLIETIQAYLSDVP
jgi:DNA-binding NtrC family response regulator